MLMGVEFHACVGWFGVMLGAGETEAYPDSPVLTVVTVSFLGIETAFHRDCPVDSEGVVHQSQTT